MVTIPLGLGDWESTTEDIPRLKMNNMYVTVNPSSEDGYSRISRPTLTEFTTVGTGPIFGIWRQEATFSGDWLVVSAQTLYRVVEATGVATEIGSVPGTGYAQFSGTADRALITRDGITYSTDGLVLTIVVMPDARLTNSTASINGYFLITLIDDDRFYWINPGETDPDALSFATAERSPDAIVGVSIISDEIWFLGKYGPEVWTATGVADAPFQRVSGRIYNEGCHSRDTVATTSVNSIPALMWVTNQKSVVVAQGVPTKISNESVEETLKTEDDLRCWAIRHNRHDFYIITSPTFTLVYDITTSFWSKWSSYNKDAWVAHLGIQADTEVYSGDSVTNQIWKLEEGVSDDGQPVVREVSGFLPSNSTPVSCSAVHAYVNAGWAPTYNFNPILELRWSADLGATWSNYVSMPLGEKGEYTKDVFFRSLGLVRAPGRVFEFRFSEPARFRLDYATMNER